MSVLARRAMLGAALVSAAGCGRKPPPLRGVAYIACQESRTIAAVDLGGLAVDHRAQLDAAPEALWLDPRRPVLFVRFRNERFLEERQLPSLALARRHRLPGTAVAGGCDAEGNAWALVREPNLLQPLAGGRPLALPAPPLGCDFARREPLACAVLEGGVAAVAELAPGRLRGAAALRDDLGEARFREDARQVLVAGRGRRVVSVVDARTVRPLVELPLPLRPDRFCLKADGGQLFITGEGRDGVAIVYPYRSEVALTTPSGRAPGVMAVSTAPDYLFIANPQAGSVTILDIDTRKVLAVTMVGAEPAALAITPGQQYALVCNRGSGDLGVIRIAAITPGRAKSAPLFTLIPVGAAPVAVVVTA